MGSLEVVDYRKKRTERVNNGAAAKENAAAPVFCLKDYGKRGILYGIRQANIRNELRGRC